MQTTMDAGVIVIPYFTYETTVTYPHVGPDGLLSHAGLLSILQEAAALASHERGFSFRTIEQTGVCWVLMGWKLETLAHPAWNTPLTIHTWPRSVDGFMSERDFEIFSEGQVVARATSRWFLLSAQTKRITRVTDAVRAAYDIDERRLFATDIPNNGTPLPHAETTYTHTVSRLDIDTYEHVNNLRYLDFALEALPTDLYYNPPATVEIVYRKQILPNTEIRCLYGRTDDGKHQIEVQSGEGDDTIHHAYLWFY